MAHATNQTNRYSLLIENKILQVFYSLPGALNYLSNSPGMSRTVRIRNSTFISPQTSEIVIWPPRYSFMGGVFLVDSCSIEFLPIDSLSGTLNITNSRLKSLWATNTKYLRVTLSGDSAISSLDFDNNKDLSLRVSNCVFDKHHHFDIQNTTVKRFDFRHSSKSGCTVFFTNDTIDTFAGVPNGIKDTSNTETANQQYSYSNYFVFKDCYINGPFVFFRPVPNAVIIFDRCTFGPNANLSDLAISTLVIRNCLDIPDQLIVSFREKNKPVRIEITNSAIDNIRLEFTSNMRLVFTRGETKDMITNSFTSLLEKFEHEGKDRSYKYLDLQYREYSDSALFHFLNGIWWYHGYEPGWVFAWASGLLALFFLINLLYWNRMYETYPIVEGQKAEAFGKKHLGLKFYSSVFLYTIFIFFTLRVNLDKLKYKRHRFVYLFLFEYLAGIWCLVFIFRFIFKI